MMPRHCRPIEETYMILVNLAIQLKVFVGPVAQPTMPSSGHPDGNANVDEKTARTETRNLIMLSCDSEALTYLVEKRRAEFDRKKEREKKAKQAEADLEEQLDELTQGPKD